jgi:hypothetical protein
MTNIVLDYLNCLGRMTSCFPLDGQRFWKSLTNLGVWEEELKKVGKKTTVHATDLEVNVFLTLKEQRLLRERFRRGDWPSKIHRLIKVALD